jgi:phosphonate dehydrogenase
VVEQLGACGELVLNQTDEALSPDELLSRARGADALMAFMCDRVDESFLAACSQLKIVSGALKGFDNIDVETATRRKIWVSNVSGHLTAPTAELAVALLLGLARKVAAGDRLVRSGKFSGWRPVLFGVGLAHQPIGILGMGRIGQAVAQRLAGFDAQLRYFDTRQLLEAEERDLAISFAPLEQLLNWAAALVVCLPLTEQTHHLLGPEQLALLPKGALVVNIGRGSVVNEVAVAKALAEGRLGGYAADVFALEDQSLPDHPRSIPASLLADVDRTIFTPHLGAAVDSIRLAIEHEAADNIVEALAGREPWGAVNRW